MKFMSIYLHNYIGIYNGLGMYELKIDLSKCIHKTITIRGDNGSGKSTLMKALSVFPDSNDSFIQGMPAMKEIVLVDGPTLYKLVFVHGVKTNGDRETTKAYVTKTIGNNVVELNENGNVSSYRDIIFSELGLDSNFEALSQLSTDDRGLADKKPAERKRFVNSIISSLDVYNNIYKTLTKKSSNYKSMINSISSKLNMIGDEESIKSILHQLDVRLKEYQVDKDNLIVSLGTQQSKVQMLDPDGSIQSTNNSLSKRIEELEEEISRIDSMIQGSIKNISIESNDIDSEYERIVDRKNSLIIQNQIDRNKIDTLMRQKEAETEELNSKIQRLSTLKSESSYETLLNKIEEYKLALKKIEDDLSVVGIKDVSSINKDEFILALESLVDLDDHIKIFKDNTSYEVMSNIINVYLSTGMLPERIDVNPLIKDKQDKENELSKLEKEQIELKAKLPLLSKLSIRPDTCIDNTCAFIKEALEFSQTNPNKRLEDIDMDIYVLDDMIHEINCEIENADRYNIAANAFCVLVRDINKNANILSKLTNGEMFADNRIFFERLLSGFSFEYMKSIYQYIDLANEFDIYKQSKNILDEYLSEMKVYESKSEAIDIISKDIDRINKSLTDIANHLDPINNDILDRELEISSLQKTEEIINGLFVLRDNRQDMSDELSNNISIIDENKKKMDEINGCISIIAKYQNDIVSINKIIDDISRDRDKASHSVQMLEEYKKEKEELEKNYEFIETIKYYSSPTTGIQLVFMELYMGKIIALANELLSYLFNGQYAIQPFIINETEFRIPCLGSGYLNDDISSMSSAQIGMISMILSFSLLYNSSTKYNIIKLDEIDGPLDYSNRLLFLDVLNRIMGIMHTEQCIMISHNSELQVDDTDVILLKHDIDNPEYRRGNIIWSY